MEPLILCIGRHLTQPKIPMKPDFMKGRHSEAKIDPETITINKLKQEIEEQKKEIEKQNQLIYAKINGNFNNKYNIKRRMLGPLISAGKTSQT